MIKRATKPSTGGSVTRVSTTKDGIETVNTTKTDVEDAIQNEVRGRFTLAHNAPIMNSSICKRLRLLEDEEFAKEIIWGEFSVPSDLDEATKLVLREINRIDQSLIWISGLAGRRFPLSGPKPKNSPLLLAPEFILVTTKRVSEATSSRKLWSAKST